MTNIKTKQITQAILNLNPQTPTQNLGPTTLNLSLQPPVSGFWRSCSQFARSIRAQVLWVYHLLGMPHVSKKGPEWRKMTAFCPLGGCKVAHHGRGPAILEAGCQANLLTGLKAGLYVDLQSVELTFRCSASLRWHQDSVRQHWHAVPKALVTCVGLQWCCFDARCTARMASCRRPAYAAWQMWHLHGRHGPSAFSTHAASGACLGTSISRSQCRPPHCTRRYLRHATDATWAVAGSFCSTLGRYPFVSHQVPSAGRHRRLASTSPVPSPLVVGFGRGQ